MTHRIALRAPLSIALLLYACGNDTAPAEVTFAARDYACDATATAASCTTDVPILDDTERTVPVAHLDTPMSRTYVVSGITLPASSTVAGGRSQAVGFNLDGLDTITAGESEDCRTAKGDFQSMVEPRGSGVDNTLESFIPTIESLLNADECPGGSTDGCLDATMLEQINAGALILLVEVGEIDDFVFDDHVTVQVSLGELASGETPMLDSGRLARGQTFRHAVDPEGRPILLGPAYDGDVFRGRLRIATDALPLSINTGARQLALTIVDAEMRFDMTETAIRRGVIGGGLPNDDVVGAARMVREDAETLVRPVVESAADVRPSATDPATCTAVSVGIMFEGVSAVME